MSKNVEAVAVGYYLALSAKDMKGVEKHIHPDIEFIAPLARVTGKKAMLEGVQNFMSFFNQLTIRAKFCTGDQAMIVYEVDCPKPVGNLPSAALIEVKEGLIRKLELFYDASPFNNS